MSVINLEKRSFKISSKVQKVFKAIKTDVRFESEVQQNSSPKEHKD